MKQIKNQLGNKDSELRSKVEQAQLNRKVKKIQKKLDKFLAEVVIDYGLAILPVIRMTSFGIVPIFDIYEATEEQIKRSKEILKKN